MHEVALARRLLVIVLAEARAQGAQRVTRVKLAVGVLALGLWPAPLLEVMQPSIHHLVEQIVATKLPV